MARLKGHKIWFGGSCLDGLSVLTAERLVKWMDGTGVAFMLEQSSLSPASRVPRRQCAARVRRVNAITTTTDWSARRERFEWSSTGAGGQSSSAATDGVTVKASNKQSAEVRGSCHHHETEKWIVRVRVSCNRTEEEEEGGGGLAECGVCKEPVRRETMVSPTVHTRTLSSVKRCHCLDHRVSLGPPSSGLSWSEPPNRELLAHACPFTELHPVNGHRRPTESALKRPSMEATLRPFTATVPFALAPWRTAARLEKCFSNDQAERQIDWG